MLAIINIQDENLREKFEVLHNACKEMTMLKFNNSNKMGTRVHESEFKEILNQKIDLKMKEIKKESLNSHDEIMKNRRKYEVPCIYRENLVYCVGEYISKKTEKFANFWSG